MATIRRGDAGRGASAANARDMHSSAGNASATPVPRSSARRDSRRPRIKTFVPEFEWDMLYYAAE
jgi:hypothetical protein